MIVKLTCDLSSQKIDIECKCKSIEEFRDMMLSICFIILSRHILHLYNCNHDMITLLHKELLSLLLTALYWCSCLQQSLGLLEIVLNFYHDLVFFLPQQ